MKSISRESRGAYQERGSKFLGFLFPIEDEEGLHGRIDALAGEHFAARHIVYAYRLPGREYSTDAGEPHGSAGPPLMNLLKANDIVLAGLAVVRYFGGVKLGKGNLARAYRAAGQAAVETAVLHLLHPFILYRCRPPMERVGDLYAAIHRFSLTVKEESFDPAPLLLLATPEEAGDSFEEYLRNLSIPYERDEEVVWERTSA